MKEDKERELYKAFWPLLAPVEEILKDDFIKRLNPQSENLKIKLQLFPWKEYVEEFHKEYKKLWDSLSLNKLYKNSLKNILESRLQSEILFRLLLDFIFLEDRRRENEFSKELSKRINEGLQLFNAFAKVCKGDKDITLGNDINVKRGKKFSGKRISNYNLDNYKAILEKNEEYKQKNGKNNYRTATFNALKSSYIQKEEIEKIYKSFKIFQKRYKIYNLEDFKNFLSTYR